MKKFSFYKYIAVFLAIFGTSCESIVDDLNVDPNNPTDASASLILTGAQVANMTIQEGHANRVANMWSGYYNGADRQYADYALYNVNAGNFNSDWSNLYQGVVSQTSLIIEKSTESNDRHMIGIAKIIKANAIGEATELWGDVPFTQTIQFDIANPEFDGQVSTLYPALLSLLDEAIADLESGEGASPGDADIHFSGAKANWIAVAHTLKARYYMDLKDYSSAYSEALEGISSPDGDMISPHGVTNDGDMNMTYDFLVVGRAGDMDAGVGDDADGEQVYAADLLDPTEPEYRGNDKTDETARFMYLYLDNGADSYTGRLEPNYLAVSNGDPYNGVVGIDADFRTVTYAENVLTLAEAGFRSQGFDVGLTYLNEFRAYMNDGGYIDPTYLVDYTPVYEAYEAADFASGGIANTDGLSADDALLMEILEERYVTFVGTYLGFNDLRRTQDDAVSIPVDMTLNRGTEFPQRLIYGQDELNSNLNAPSPVPGVFDRTEIYQ
ncbi:MAG: SusD/RagB family nutrient-binding outer membrane lipoprotein [Thalassobius sp.]|nr:SusD/RagB family nutrient-binding outer membrane lipoprotein [Thalassovita sp.]